MSMTVDNRTVCEWRDLPDPTSTCATKRVSRAVRVSCGCWRHIMQRHANDTRLLWNEWFGPDVWRTLRQNDASQDSRRWLAAAVAASARAESDVRACLDRPQVVVRRGPTVKWLLILKSGAFVVIKDRGNSAHVCTMYFPDIVDGTASHRRWRWLAYRELQRGTRLCPRRNRVPKPDRDFVTPANWGWKTALNGEPWQPPLPPWADATESMGPRVTLRQRWHHQPAAERTSHGRA